MRKKSAKGGPLTKVCSQCDARYPEDTTVCPKDGTILSSVSKKSDPIVGKIVDGRYKVLEQVGGGGMGAVYKAEHTMMNRIVALKILHRHLLEESSDDEFLQRFQREARMASKIEHPNAVTIYDFGIHAKQPYLVMQFNTGRTLRAIIDEYAPLPSEYCSHLLGQVGSALNAAHQLGIIHRDLKPDNIMITESDEGELRAQVLDFGIAKVITDDKPADNTLTQAGLVMGTPDHMSPEQVMGHPLDERSDIYSLGLVLYEMLSGKAAFEADSPMQMMLQQINKPAIPLQKAAAGIKVSDEIAAVVMKTLEKEPEKRPQSVEELVKSFREASSGKSALPENVIPAGALLARLEMERKRVEEIEAERESNVQVKSVPARWHIAASVCIAFLCLTVGFFLHPVVEQYDEEAQSARAAALERSSRSEKMLERGAEYLEDKRYRAALSELRMAVKLDSSSAIGHFQLASAYGGLGRYEQAVASLQKAIRIDPKFARAHLDLGDNYYKMGEFKEAVRAYRKALKLDPNNLMARKNLDLLREIVRKKS